MPYDYRGKTDADIKREHPDAFGSMVFGYSMNRVIRPGSIVHTSASAEVRDGDIAIVRIHDEGCTLKRVHFEGDTVILRPESDDPDWQEDSRHPADRVSFVGRVVHWYEALPSSGIVGHFADQPA